MIDETCPGCGLVAHAGGCFGGLHAETLREQKRAHGSECFDAGCPSEVEHCRGSGLPCAPRGLEEVVCRVCGRTFHQIEGMVAPMHTELPIPHLPCLSEHLWVLDPKHPLPDHFVCAHPHIDKGIWAVRPHRNHRCGSCRLEWRPANVPTVGVAELPKEI